jgi:tRNA1(Val) A37 N6-methylase TrmN6
VVKAMEAVYKSYYTKSTDIVEAMLKKLSIAENSKILEPCAGDGVFVDSILEANPDAQIDVIELNPTAFKLLQEKYRFSQNITVFFDDALTSDDLYLKSSFGGYYDRIIANPPYGGWQDYDKRKTLKKLYNHNIYIKETYTVFLYRCIQLLKDKGILVFIIPDTFLNLHMHTNLRKYILTHTLIKEIMLFPSSFFPGINFGYSNLSIITLQKSNNKTECLNNKVKIMTNFQKVEEINNPPNHSVTSMEIPQMDLFNNDDHAIFILKNTIASDIIKSSGLTIGDIASCVTGFYSGNDKAHLRTSLSNNHRNSSKYQKVNSEQIYHGGNKLNIIDGVGDTNYFIPILKGGAIKYYKKDFWYIDWSIESVCNYKKDRKARFQNSGFYFREGIGIPMISSSQITASLIDNRLFDQSIVGVFPKDEKWLFFLLGFFNSPTCNTLIRTINCSTNNSANYIKKIPFIKPGEKVLSKSITW